jgi:hypothetical protein
MRFQGDGLNTKLPGAQEEGRFDNKLSFYDQAARDSIKLAESIRNDPYYKQDLQSFTQSSLSGYPDALNYSPGLQPRPESSEKKLLEKLAILEEQLQEPSPEQKRYNTMRLSSVLRSFSLQLLLQIFDRPMMKIFGDSARSFVPVTPRGWQYQFQLKSFVSICASSGRLQS